LNPAIRFLPVELALRDPNGLLAAGDDLSTNRLLQAYERGIFPWFGDGDPVLWWSPDPRMVLGTAAVKVSRSLRKTLRSGRYRVTADTEFPAVIAACAEPRPGQDGTWITSAVLQAYCELAELGVAHSIEAGTATSSPAASTAWRSGGCSSASRCSRAAPTRRRWRWSTWSGSCGAGASR
jgi:leucyl/phenylalanyl-tRNA--protein transferase